MSFSIGIIGLPNVGKSTLFKALTKISADIAPYPFTTIDPNIGIVQVPDERLKKIAKIIEPEKITPTIIEFIDIAGIIKNAHKGEGLGSQFLAQIRNCDAVLEVVRNFDEPNIENLLGEINPEKEIKIIQTELLMKDLESLNKDKTEIKKMELLKKLKDWISQGKLISEITLDDKEKNEIKNYQFLTQKPFFYILNTNNGLNSLKDLSLKFQYLAMNLKDEAEMTELSDSEKEELSMSSQLDQLILVCYNILDLITFYTVTGGKETRAWTLKKGLTVLEAGGVVHTDFKEKFIKAEIINWQKLVEAKGWRNAQELGWLKIVGKDYIVEDGDIIEFKI